MRTRDIGRKRDNHYTPEKRKAYKQAWSEAHPRIRTRPIGRQKKAKTVRLAVFKSCVVCGADFLPRSGNPAQEVYCGALCREKARWRRRRERAESKGCKYRKPQNPEQIFEFACGCVGILPKTGEANQFVGWRRSPFCRAGGSWVCRISEILRASKQAAIVGGFVAIRATHAEVRRLMLDVNCGLCGGLLDWRLGKMTTPHLHHNHQTGEALSFVHPLCNALEGGMSTTFCLRVLQERGYDITKIEEPAQPAVRATEE